jgi:hypothetical protein
LAAPAAADLSSQPPSGSGLTQNTAVPVVSGQTYTARLTPTAGQLWFVVQVQTGQLPPPAGDNGAVGPKATALLLANVVSRSGKCDALATVLTADQVKLGQGNVASHAQILVTGIAKAPGMFYLRISAQPGSRCRQARYAVQMDAQPAKASTGVAKAKARVRALSASQFRCFADTQLWNKVSVELARHLSRRQRRRLNRTLHHVRRAARRDCR